MNDSKGIAVIVLAVICVVLFVAFVSLAVGLQKQKGTAQEEIAKRLNAEEQLEKAIVDNSIEKSNLEKLQKELSDVKNALEQETLVTGALKSELQKEKDQNQKLKSGSE